MTNYLLPKILHGADYNYEQWLDYPEVHNEDFELMKKANCNVMSIGIFSWSKLEPKEGEFDFDWLDKLMDRLHENGLKAILATPTGSKPVWMSKKYPEVCRVDVNGKREPHGTRHNHCRTSPKFREKSVIINNLLANRYKNHPALLMWHVSNEYNSCECYCNHCISAFRDWLRKRYVSIENLNKAWWTTFWSHTFSDWDEIDPVDKSVHGLMIDWQRFTSDQTLDFFLTESAPLRNITPQIPITTNFMKPDVGLDYWAFAPYVDIISWDSYPTWHREEKNWEEAVKTGFYHDLFRSMKEKPFMLMESSPNVTNWQGVSIPKRDNMHLLSSLQAIAHGSDTVQYFQWRQSRGGEEKFHGAVVTHGGTENGRVFKGVKQVGEALNKINSVCGSSSRTEVAIMYDFQNEWAIAHSQFARNEEKNYQKTCISHYESFWKMGIGCDIKDFSCKDLTKYKIVVAPMVYMVRDGIDEVFKEFVKKGGILVITYLSGYVDESDLCFLGGSPGPLKELLGITVEDSEILNDFNKQSLIWNGENYNTSHFSERVHLTTAKVIAKFGDGVLNELPGITENEYGLGKTFFIASRNDQNLTDLFYGKLCNKNKLPEGISIVERFSGENRYIFVMNFNSESTEVNLEIDGLSELLTEKKEKNKITLEPFGVRVFKQ
ncbi:MAG: beta-galactosidase [Spirochaetales bacterium]|nr:beta-galactosidase [Spirochaetales bacterium]